MCSVVATFIRTMLSLTVALTLLHGLVGAPAGAPASPVVVAQSCADEAADAFDGCPADEAEASDEDRVQEPILGDASPLLALAPLPSHLAPRAEIRDPQRFASEHDRPPRRSAVSPRGGADRSA